MIAWPCPTKQGQASSHGTKLGAPEVAGLKEALGLDPAQDFYALMLRYSGQLSINSPCVPVAKT